MIPVTIAALIIIALLAGICIGAWLVNSAYKADAEQGRVVVIGGKIYRFMEVDNVATTDQE
jgi:flagellar basal body-associated protein FliL